jgi:hypothetical protein
VKWSGGGARVGHFGTSDESAKLPVALTDEDERGVGAGGCR